MLKKVSPEKKTKEKTWEWEGSARNSKSGERGL
jgi:hypothetical protein